MTEEEFRPKTFFMMHGKTKCLRSQLGLGLMGGALVGGALVGGALVGGALVGGTLGPEWVESWGLDYCVMSLNVSVLPSQKLLWK